jgi:glycosyltransferase involved in cell wall biosynthesis
VKLTELRRERIRLPRAFDPRPRTHREGARADDAGSSRGGARPRLAVAMTFPVHPPLGGGQVRAFNLYRELSRVFDVELVTLAPPGTRPVRSQLAPGLWEHRVPKSDRHAGEEAQLEREAGTLVTDVAMSQLYRHTPEYLRALERATAGASAAIACHPYTFPAIREVTDVPLWYEAQDVEALLKARVLAGTRTARALLAQVTRIERACCRQADLVWACSGEDREELIRRYKVKPEKVVIVPNGVALDELSYVPVGVRQEHKRRLGMDGRFIAVFIASWHEPNVIAARMLLDLATRVPTIEFLILGSVGMALRRESLPANVELLGTVSAEFKRTVLGIADVALNPVTTGSGTNIKMLDYFGSGVPVVSTAFGARGLGVRGGEHYLAAEPEEFEGTLAGLQRAEVKDVDAMVGAARKHVETRLSWSAISAQLLATLCVGA